MKPFASRSLLRAACLLTFALLPSAARAQDLDDISIGGLVTDQHGAALPGATVTASNEATRAERAATTDGEGRYRLVELAPGSYTVRASAEGFAPEEKKGLTAVAGQGVRLDFTLRPAGLAAEQVVVVSGAETPAVDTSRVVVGGTLTRAEIERLPVASRSPLDFVFTLGGVAEEPLSVRDVAQDRDPSGRPARAATTPEEAGNFSLSGGPAYANNVTVDGLDSNDDRAARERFQPPLDSIEEVQVVTSQFSAEYGRASGGRVNLRTRAGTQHLRGRLSYFFADESLNANTYNNNRRGLGRLPFQQHTPGFTLGGPLRFSRTTGDDARPKLFFFAAYEYDTVLDSTLIDALVPVEQNPLFPLPRPTTPDARRPERSAAPPNAPAELAPFTRIVNTPLRAHAFTARLDREFNATHNGSLVLQLGRSRDLRQFAGGRRLPESLQGRARHTEAISYTDNLVLSQTAVNQLRAQLSRLRPAARANTARPVVLIDIDDPLDAERSGTLVAGSSTAGSTERAETRFQLQETLTLLRGSHTFKIGADLHHLRSTFRDLSDATGTYTFSSASDFLADTPSRFRQRFNTDSEQKNLYTGFFINEEWRPLPRLTLTFGLRYENETVLRDRDNLAPRLALALDPTGTGRTVIRAGAGLFYNRALLRTVEEFTLGETAIDFDTNNLPISERRAFIASNLRFPEILSANSPLVQQLGTRRLTFARRLDPRLRIPESYQFNLGAERELARGFVIEANYTFNRGIRLWREFNANAPRLPSGFRNFTDYLLTRDFSNFLDASGARPLYNAQSAGDLVRFTLAPASSDSISRVVEFGVPVSVFNLNAVNSSTTLEAALGALQPLRPDPMRTQIEQLVSAGNSFYHGLTLEGRRRFRDRRGGFGYSLRGAYTLSRLIDDGVVNTSSALRVADFNGERAPGLQDRRHRLALSAMLDTPRWLGSLSLATILRAASGAPFNLTLGGSDRNLDDVSNDRPSFRGLTSAIRWREPGSTLDPGLVEAFSLPPIGSTGDLRRNAGRGPGLFTFDLSLTREFRFSERTRLRPVVEFDNVLNKRVFTFGAEFINFDALRPGASDEQRRTVADTFLVPTRTLRPRAVRLGVRVDF